METKTGTLYGIGVGPGDPDLLTIKAVNILKSVDVVFAASSIKNKHSLAVDIAQPHISEGTDVRALPFQMSNNEAERGKLWEQNAKIILSELQEGRSVAFLTLGDSLTYSTFGYLLKIIKQTAPHINVVSVPGITSYQAAAARINTPLVEGDESLLVTSGARGGDELRKCGTSADNVVLLKAYKNVTDINSALKDANLLENSIGISKCGRKDEQIVRDVREFEKRKPDYWTLVIAKRNMACNK
ncbi:MAG: precorrin-2 C(20)-methyltransferase [Desulfobacteraceae bacterium]|nr:precorrin-2 C(20)-methyltransferase [Desulfobacteraceae bacterium]